MNDFKTNRAGDQPTTLIVVPQDEPDEENGGDQEQCEADHRVEALLENVAYCPFIPSRMTIDHS